MNKIDFDVIFKKRCNKDVVALVVDSKGCPIVTTSSEILYSISLDAGDRISGRVDFRTEKPCIVSVIVTPIEPVLLENYDNKKIV